MFSMHVFVSARQHFCGILYLICYHCCYNYIPDAVQFISGAFRVACTGNLCFGKCVCFTLQSMGRTDHKFPVCATWNVQTHLKSAV